MSALGDEIARMIAHEGPISVERYMALCLGHPRYGYYATRDPFGASGDFTTAPEVSQMFGELLGLWAAEVWRLMRSPVPVHLVELGPGRGTLMADALRATRVRSDFRKALELHLVDTSPALRERQRQALAATCVPLRWHDRLDDVPDGPTIVLANEFFDALPVRQYVRTERGWCERLIGLDASGALAFGVAPEPEQAMRREAPEGALIEINAAGLSLAVLIAQRLARAGGTALIIDYGYTRSGFGETLQAVKRHAFADPLAEPGEADLTAHVDFAALGVAAHRSGAAVRGPVTQREFLTALGIGARAEALKRKADVQRRAAIEAALDRLSGCGPGDMGALFKVMAIAHLALPVLPGFQKGGRQVDDRR